MNYQNYYEAMSDLCNAQTRFAHLYLNLSDAGCLIGCDVSVPRILVRENCITLGNGGSDFERLANANCRFISVEDFGDLTEEEQEDLEDSIDSLVYRIGIACDCMREVA